MFTYNYSVSTQTIWTSFDYGTVEANSIEEARVKALEKLNYDFEKANEAFDHCDITKGFRIEFNEKDLQITLEE